MADTLHTVQTPLATQTSAVSAYKPPLFFTNAHVQTIFPTLFRTNPVVYTRERISTPDNDFLDLDWLSSNSDRCIILCHGLEGSSQSNYIRGMARAFSRRGIDVLAWNFRGCSGESNTTARFYHSGATEDLQTVLSHILACDRYRRIDLIGFSLGGNMMLKYLGDGVYDIPKVVQRAVAFSVPCDLAACSAELARPHNTLYMKRFLRLLHGKIRAKMNILPGVLDDSNYSSLRTFQDFDDRYTAPLHGFRDANHYWSVCNSRQFISSVRIPTLLVNALDDPFLAPTAYPAAEAQNNPLFTLETPRYGGHCGFVLFNREEEYWSEQRATHFLQA
jgi:predicted alpha/beta-fold hydrolase